MVVWWTSARVPILPNRDLDETLEFYARVGFEPRGRWVGRTVI